MSVVSAEVAAGWLARARRPPMREADGCYYRPEPPHSAPELKVAGRQDEHDGHRHQRADQRHDGVRDVRHGQAHCSRRTDRGGGWAAASAAARPGRGSEDGGPRASSCRCESCLTIDATLCRQRGESAGHGEGGPQAGRHTREHAPTSGYSRTCSAIAGLLFSHWQSMATKKTLITPT